jgi:hypothetical protein
MVGIGSSSSVVNAASGDARLSDDSLIEHRTGTASHPLVHGPQKPQPFPRVHRSSLSTTLFSANTSGIA